jgi:hypothetical protein
MPRAHKDGDYCRGQAAHCAHAASDRVLPDVKEAYRNLEQGWLQLALEFESELKQRPNAHACQYQKAAPATKERR